ncbi:TetR family transcriptional regulator [Nonomuraea sp. NPDC050790]|uniref:TetR family transcriptional regulator n=1 Tax=Nonomuraea sp. NPDC050790 TaxID=3364371 RepID=UPI00378B21C8
MIDTRGRILAAAGELFARKGSQNTSVREIAEALGLTKTAVLYHFRTKADILATLAQPLIDDTDAAVERVAREGGGGWGTVETLLEVYLRHREVLSTVVSNMPGLPTETFERWFAAMHRAGEMVAGPDPDLAARVRAIQVVALLSDPVILLQDVPTDDLRHHILNGARRLFPDPPPLRTPPRPGEEGAAAESERLGAEPSTERELQAAVGEEQPLAGARRREAEERRAVAKEEGPLAGKAQAEEERSASGGDGGGLGQEPRGLRAAGGEGKGGRPRVMSGEMVAEARRLRKNGDRTVSEIAAALGVSRATLYRHL